ncbi:MAG: cobalamin-binding protein [marine bacterium B5-7]|nr:MAG: cobalamin-binding protein [marine bacterium B5-7]
MLTAMSARLQRNLARISQLFTIILAAISLFISLMAYGADEIRIEDARGKVIVLNQPATRIISLAPHIVENLFAIGADSTIVGVTAYSDYPAAANNIEVIGTYKQFDIERILELQPDIIVGWLSGNPGDAIESLERLGLPVFLSEPRTIEDVARELRNLGRLTGRDSMAQEVASRFTEQMKQITDRYSARTSVKVFYQVWNDPLITLNGDHLISKLIEGCGAVNIFADLDQLAPRIGIEAVLDRNPDVILAGSKDSESSASVPASLKAWSRYPFLSATAHNNLFQLNPDLLQRHTTRLVDGMDDLCKHIDTARQRLTR